MIPGLASVPLFARKMSMTSFTFNKKEHTLNRKISQSFHNNAKHVGMLFSLYKNVDICPQSCYSFNCHPSISLPTSVYGHELQDYLPNELQAHPTSYLQYATSVNIEIGNNNILSSILLPWLSMHAGMPSQIQSILLCLCAFLQQSGIKLFF